MDDATYLRSSRDDTLRMKLRRAAGPLVSHSAIGAFAARLFGNVIPHRGLKVDVSSGLVSPATKAALLFRAYESAEIRFMQKYLPRDRDVVELGGSIGVMSCLIRRRIAKDQRLLVAEADPRLGEILKANLRLNGCETGTLVETVAIGAEGQGSVSFETGTRSDSGRVASGGSTGHATIEVPALTLTQLLDRHEFGRYCLVSDIEGAEWELWRNQREALSRADWMIFETHDHSAFGRYPELIDQMAADPAIELVDRYGPVIVLRNPAAA
jgi:FkbM family methyltransferase